MRYFPEGFTLTRKGVERDSSSKRVSGSGTPARPARATRWMIALVEPPIAMSPRIALSKAFAVRISEGRGPPACASSTARRPLSSASARRRESGAGIAALPGSVMPRASAIEAIVDAVPMTMQWPDERDMQDSASQSSSSDIRPARRSAQSRQASVPEPSSSVRHLSQVRVAVGELGPRVGDADHGTAVEDEIAEPFGLEPRAVDEAVEVVAPEPVAAPERVCCHGNPPRHRL